MGIAEAAVKSNAIIFFRESYVPLLVISCPSEEASNRNVRHTNNILMLTQN